MINAIAFDNSLVSIFCHHQLPLQVILNLYFLQDELLRVLYPVFIHCFMDLVAKGYVQEGRMSHLCRSSFISEPVGSYTIIPLTRQVVTLNFQLGDFLIASVMTMR